MSAAVFAGLFAVLFVVAIGCFRMSAWHTQEANYWHGIASRVRLDPELDEHYRPILTWVQANRPGKWERMRGWQSPEQRMGVSA